MVPLRTSLATFAEATAIRKSNLRRPRPFAEATAICSSKTQWRCPFASATAIRNSKIAEGMPICKSSQRWARPTQSISPWATASLPRLYESFRLCIAFPDDAAAAHFLVRRSRCPFRSVVGISHSHAPGRSITIPWVFVELVLANDNVASVTLDVIP